MVKKIIQVPVDEDLLKNLDNLSKKQRRARAEVIRAACSRYLQQVAEEEQVRQYRQGYLKYPEETAAGEAQIKIAGEIMAGETW